MLENNQVTEEWRKRNQEYLEANDNENTMTQNLQDAVKAVVRGKFIAIQAYFEKQRETLRKQHNLPYLKQQEKEQQKNLKVSRHKEIIKMRAEN